MAFDSLTPSVSVIVPVFNAAQYLDRCLDSILGQTLSDLEVICVDDCSTDNSLEILRDFCDNRLRIISFPVNRGVSAARNAGLDAARGKYVYFIDSDDWLDSDYLEEMFVKAEETCESVVVNSNYIEEFPEEGKRAFSSRFGFIEDEPAYYPSLVIQNKFPPVVWARMYCADFLRLNSVRFPGPGVRNGTEDIYFTGLVSSFSDSGFVFRGPYYHYLQRPESLLHQNDLCYYNIVSFKALWDEKRRRGMDTEGLRLFYGGTVIIDSSDKFDFAQSFFREIADEVFRHSSLYAPLDIFLLQAVLSSKDYSDYLARFNMNISISFIKNRMAPAKRLPRS